MAVWQINGSAIDFTGTLTDFRLTPAASNQGGTIFQKNITYPVDGLSVGFTTQATEGGGVGDADGFTCALLDPVRQADTSIGVTGAGVGGVGLIGGFLQISTYAPYSWRGYSWCHGGSNSDGMNEGHFVRKEPPVMLGTHDWHFSCVETGTDPTYADNSWGLYTITVQYDAETPVVWTGCRAPKVCTFGFTAATGAGFDNHYVRNITPNFITAGGWVLGKVEVR